MARFSLLHLLAAGAGVAIFANGAAVTADVAPAFAAEAATNAVITQPKSLEARKNANGSKRGKTDALGRNGDRSRDQSAGAVQSETASNVPPPLPPIQDLTSAPLTRLGISITESAAARDKSLAEQSRELTLKEKVLKAAEARAARSLAAARAAAGAKTAAAAADDANVPENRGVKAPAASVASEDAERMQGLARIYQAMKPAKAAAVFEKLDLRLQVKVAREMSERSVAQMLNVMDPGNAAELSMALASRAPRSATAAVKPQPTMPTPTAG